MRCLTCALLGDLPDGAKLTAEINESILVVETFGTADSVAEIGEQLAWLGAALRSSPYDLGIAHCTPFIDVHLDTPASTLDGMAGSISCKIGFIVEGSEDHLEPSNGQCWHNMFRNPVIVKGYPIPHRSVPDTGLEIPLPIMAALARTKLVDVFNGKLFIKGFSTMLVPTKQSGDVLMWHLLYNKDGKRISYLDNTVPNVATVSISDLENLRHVLGWCSEATSYAGKNDV